MTINAPSCPTGDNRRCARQIALLVLLALALPGTPAASKVPVVFRVSEGIRPTALVSIYGEYLTGALAVRFLEADGMVAATQPAVQSDPGGHFCRVVFPGIPPGAYQLAVQNAAGWSTQKIFVNRADPRWISEERAYPGLTLKLMGRNLDASEYHGARNTQVRLAPANGDKPTVVAPDAVNPYCVDFTVPADLAAGDYFVEVCANSAASGRDWVRLDNHSEFPETIRATVIRVEPAPVNPTALALKVAWANDFDWSYVADAKPKFDLLRNQDVSAKQAPYYVSGSGPMLVAGCQFFISSRNLRNHQVKNRVTFRNNSSAIRGTIYENCPQPVNDRGDNTASLPGAAEPLRMRALAPTLPAGTGRQCVPATRDCQPLSRNPRGRTQDRRLGGQQRARPRCRTQSRPRVLRLHRQPERCGDAGSRPLCGEERAAAKRGRGSRDVGGQVDRQVRGRRVRRRARGSGTGGSQRGHRYQRPLEEQDQLAPAGSARRRPNESRAL